jgi:polyhydroxyalkanoate synthesis regulator protein
MAKRPNSTTAEASQDVLKDAIKFYEEALKSGIQLQEESLDMWRNFLKQLGTPEELREKLETMSGGLFPENKEKLEAILKTFQENSKQGMELFNKALSVYQSTSVVEGQARFQDLMESSLTTMRTNVHTVLDTNSKIMDSWNEMVEKVTLNAR